MLGWAISVGIETLLDNDFYATGGKYYKQIYGAPEGVDTSLEPCDMYMLVWDDKCYILIRRSILEDMEA